VKMPEPLSDRDWDVLAFTSSRGVLLPFALMQSMDADDANTMLEMLTDWPAGIKVWRDKGYEHVFHASRAYWGCSIDETQR
jgi:hypothetical protein